MTDHIEFLYDTVVKLRPGLKSRRVMVDKEKKLSEFSTADLVAELCSREGIRIKHVMQPEKYEIRVYRDHEFMESSGKYDGPARIIVIRGDER